MNLRHTYCGAYACAVLRTNCVRK